MYLESKISSTSYSLFGLLISVVVTGVLGVPLGAGSSNEMWNTGCIFMLVGSSSL
jgi:hypothetical protein